MAEGFHQGSILMKLHICKKFHKNKTLKIFFLIYSNCLCSGVEERFLMLVDQTDNSFCVLYIGH